MKELQFHIKGISPLLLHSTRGVNPTDPLVVELKKLTSKKTKTPEDIEGIAKLEWMVSMYVNANGKPSMPGENIEALLREGRVGKITKANMVAAVASEGPWPIIYSGPKDLDKLWETGQFCDTRAVRVMSSRVMRSRPRFEDWELKFSVLYAPDMLSEAQVVGSLKRGGREKGIGDFRPRFGRFEIIG